MFHDAAEKGEALAPTGRAASRVSAKALALPARSHSEMWQWQPLPVRPGKGLGMKVARRPCFSATDLTMNLKNDMPVGGGERVVVLPVHLELAVRVLMVVLIGLPAERQHVVADLGDDVVAAHQGLLIVAGLLGDVGGIGDLDAVRRDEEELALRPRSSP